MRRLVGLVMILISLPSLFLTVYLLVQIWNLRQPFTNNLLSGVDLATTMLDSAADGLVTIQLSLDTTTENITILERSTQTLAQSLHDTGPLITSLTALTGRDLPTTITATQRSLDSAESSALLVDDVLAALTRIPFMPVAPYQPKVPLHTAIDQVSTSLDSLSPSLASLDKSLQATTGNLAAIETQTKEMTQNIQRIKSNLAEMKLAVDRYQTIVYTLRTQVTELRVALPAWVTLGTMIISFVLGWLALTQVGWLFSGARMLR